MSVRGGDCASCAQGSKHATRSKLRHADRPMAATEWREWPERHVSTLNHEHLETLEAELT